MVDSVEEFIETLTDDDAVHYGVKGQRWGVRKSRSRSGAPARTQFSKKASELDDDELQRRIRRMESERRYNDLNRQEVSAGRNFVGRVMDRSGTQIVSTIVTGAGLFVAARALDRRFGAGSGQAITNRDFGSFGRSSSDS